MALLDEKILAIVDVETTGASPVHDRVIEIGIIRVENGRITGSINTLLNPEQHLPPFITRVTGIEEDSLRGAPVFEGVREQVEKLLEGAIFVAHNARFDYGFIKNELKRSGVSYNAKCLCTVRLSRKLYPSEKSHNLDALIERHGFSCENRHRAYDDARVLYDFLDIAKKRSDIDEHVKSLLSESTLPQFLNERSIKSLPEGPGVYIFYGPEDEVLYVGKSKNVRYRVLSHFSSDHASQKEMNLCQQTVRVEARETAGELGALLLESELVKDWMPLYNRQLRKRSDLVAVRLMPAGRHGYPEARIERIQTVDTESQREVLGIFRTVAQARSFLRAAVNEYGLCPRLLGLEKGKGACFSHQIQVCSGACVEKPDPEEYAQAFKQVFKARRVRSWPFPGPILIEEKLDSEASHSFVLDNWCLVADVRSEPDNTVVVTHSPRFDYDAYKIFYRYIKDPLTRRRIKKITRKELAQSLRLYESA